MVQEGTVGGGDGAGADAGEGVLVQVVREFGDSVRVLGEYAAWRRRDTASLRSIATGEGPSGIIPARKMALVYALILSRIMYLLISLRESNPPQNRQLNISIRYSDVPEPHGKRPSGVPLGEG